MTQYVTIAIMRNKKTVLHLGQINQVLIYLSHLFSLSKVVVLQRSILFVKRWKVNDAWFIFKQLYWINFSSQHWVYWSFNKSHIISLVFQGFNCEPGQGGHRQYLREMENCSLVECKDECSRNDACIGFDYTDICMRDTCRLFPNRTRRADPGPHNRQYCSKLGITTQ